MRPCFIALTLMCFVGCCEVPKPPKEEKVLTAPALPPKPKKELLIVVDDDSKIDMQQPICLDCEIEKLDREIEDLLAKMPTPSALDPENAPADERYPIELRVDSTLLNIDILSKLAKKCDLVMQRTKHDLAKKRAAAFVTAPE